MKYDPSHKMNMLDGGLCFDLVVVLFLLVYLNCLPIVCRNTPLEFVYFLHHGPVARYKNCGLCMHRECRERFPRHHGTHVPRCMPGSLISCFLWSRWRGKRSRHSRRIRNPQFYVSGNWPMDKTCHYLILTNYSTAQALCIFLNIYCLLFVQNL